MAEQQAPRYLVVIGASAGGIEAISAVIGELPEDFSAPIVIAQHLDPTRPSHLAQILGRRTRLSVRTVTEREALSPGVVYVVPANRHVRITDAEVTVQTHDGQGPRPSVDLLLVSAAQAYGEQLIAVILTGTGTDGTAGAREVHQTGGTVVIQNPETAAFPAMPLSLSPTDVDIIADVENIGAILQDLISGARVSGHATEERALRSFLEQLRERSGIDFNAYKTPTIMRRLQRRMIATNNEQLSDYIRYLQAYPEEYQRLVSSFLIKVTEFFRDAQLFDFIRDHILPELIAQARDRDNELRFWSAGCATGEEAYSLAILICDLLGEEIGNFNVRIFATDLDNGAVTFARRGVYPASAVSTVPAAMLDRYFNKVNGEYEIKKHVRALTVFGQHDLGQRAPFPRIDLTLCRNVLIYFTTELQKRALQLFAFSLRDGGYLALGKSETTNPLAAYFALDQPHLKIYRRHGDRILIPPASIRDVAPLAPLRPARAPIGEQSRAAREIVQSRSPRERWEAILLNLPVGIVVVDRRYDIQVINSAARQFFGIHPAAIGDDFIHLTQTVPTAPLRAAIDAAFRGDAPVTSEALADTDLATGESRDLEIACYPQKLENGAEATDSVLILVTNVTSRAQSRRNMEEALVRQREETDRLTALMKRLADTNRQLLEANQELSNSNIELRSANEEFLVSSEEAQAATEEIETLNEELQATNEELETLNEELQATVEELTTTNDDLQTRTIELQDMTTTNDGLQARTTELQDLTDSLEMRRKESEGGRVLTAEALLSESGAVIVVNGAGEIVLINARYTERFGDTLAPFGAEDGALLQRAARGESFTTEAVATLTDGTRRRFRVTGEPIQARDTGGVLVLREMAEGS